MTDQNPQTPPAPASAQATADKPEASSAAQAPEDRPKIEAPKQPLPPDVEQNKLMAAICYLSILFIIPLLTDAKNNDYVKFHLRQGIALFVVDVIGGFVAWIPAIGWVISLGLLFVSVYAFIQAYEGKRWEMPVIGEYAKKINI